MNTELADLRREYSLKSLSISTVDKNPVAQFAAWMGEALKSEIIDVNAMTLSTVGADRHPSARVVLLKDYDDGGFVFFTNYSSRKGHELFENPWAHLLFFWPPLERQVAISGKATKIPRAESENYFNSRPLQSRLSAIASHQSSKIESREALEARVAELQEQFRDADPPCPDNWGGYRVVPETFEFWQGRESRLHDRVCYELVDGDWQICLLSP